jgi:hypothetical protein
MRRALPFLVALALVGGALALLLRPGDPVDTLELDPAATPSGTDDPGSGAGVGLAPRGDPPRPPPSTTERPGTPVAIDPRTLARGTLTVEVLGPDDQPLPGDQLTVRVVPGKGGERWHATPMMRYDEATKLWSSSEVRVGPVKVHVFGETIVPTDVETVVAKEPGERLRVHVDRAGRIEYAVTTLGGEPPGDVDVSLLRANRNPQIAYYQVRTETVLTEPRRAREVRQGPVGVIFGIPPGRYTVRVTSQAGEFEEAEVEVEAEKTQQVALKVRR